MELTLENFKKHINNNNKNINYWTMLHIYAICGEDLEEFELDIPAEQINAEWTQKDVIHLFLEKLKEANIVADVKDIDVDIQFPFCAETRSDFLKMQYEYENKGEFEFMEEDYV